MSAPDYESIYDFETAIETAVKAALVDAGLTVYSGADAASIRKERPRCEILFNCGSALGHVIKIGGYHRDDQFNGSLGVTCVTSSGESETTHRTYRATVRNVMSAIVGTLNDDATTLPYHHIMRIDHQSLTPVYQPEDGIQTSTLIYTLDFAIRTDAWP